MDIILVPEISGDVFACSVCLKEMSFRENSPQYIHYLKEPSTESS